MSLAIDVDHITAVLLSDGWHDVVAKSFTTDSYEYLWYPSAGSKHDFQLLHGGGASGVCATGFEFKTADGDRMAGPLTAIQAVRHKES
jgi:hypothetical protein